MFRAIIPSSKLQLGIQVVVLPRESAKDELRVYFLLDVVYTNQPEVSRSEVDVYLQPGHHSTCGPSG